MESLQYIARDTKNRQGVSATAQLQAIKDQQETGSLEAAGRAMLSPLNTARDYLDGKMIQNNAMAFAEALQNPEKVAKLKELRKLKPSHERAVAMLSVVGLGNYALGSGADLVTSPLDAEPQTPPDLQPEAP